MNVNSGTLVWIDIADDGLRRRAESALTAGPLVAQIVEAHATASGETVAAGPPTTATPGAECDVIVTDRPKGHEIDEANVGLVVIGVRDEAADASLDFDFSDRELLLACQLVAKLAHWRREARRTAATGRELDRLANTDVLTHLANRRAWDIELPRRLAVAQGAGMAVALAILDIDRFKSINDDLGHAAGDAVLAAAGKGLADSLRSGDFVARLGGDEFGLLLVGSFDARQSAQIVERVRRHAMRQLQAIDGRPISLSAGAASAGPGATADLAALLAAADQALGAAKREGRDRTVTANP